MIMNDVEVNPGLAAALDEFICARTVDNLPAFGETERLNLEAYRRIILEHLQGGEASFDTFPMAMEDVHLDRARRFITLVFMEHGREVRLEQRNTGILVIPCA